MSIVSLHPPLHAGDPAVEPRRQTQLVRLRQVLDDLLPQPLGRYAVKLPAGWRTRRRLTEAQLVDSLLGRPGYPRLAVPLSIPDRPATVILDLDYQPGSRDADELRQWATGWAEAALTDTGARLILCLGDGQPLDWWAAVLGNLVRDLPPGARLDKTSLGTWHDGRLVTPARRRVPPLGLFQLPRLLTSGDFYPLEAIDFPYPRPAVPAAHGGRRVPALPGPRPSTTTSHVMDFQALQATSRRRLYQVKEKMGIGTSNPVVWPREIPVGTYFATAIESGLVHQLGLTLDTYEAWVRDVSQGIELWRLRERLDKTRDYLLHSKPLRSQVGRGTAHRLNWDATFDACLLLAIDAYQPNRRRRDYRTRLLELTAGLFVMLMRGRAAAGCRFTCSLRTLKRLSGYSQSRAQLSQQVMPWLKRLFPQPTDHRGYVLRAYKPTLKKQVDGLNVYEPSQAVLDLLAAVPPFRGTPTNLDGCDLKWEPCSTNKAHTPYTTTTGKAPQEDLA